MAVPCPEFLSIYFQKSSVRSSARGQRSDNIVNQNFKFMSKAVANWSEVIHIKILGVSKKSNSSRPVSIDEVLEFSHTVKESFVGQEVCLNAAKCSTELGRVHLQVVKRELFEGIECLCAITLAFNGGNQSQE